MDLPGNSPVNFLFLIHRPDSGLISLDTELRQTMLVAGMRHNWAIVLVFCAMVYSAFIRSPAPLGQLSQARHLSEYASLIAPLRVIGCTVSERAYTTVERCDVRAAPDLAHFHQILGAKGWLVSAQRSVYGPYASSWCKGTTRIQIDQIGDRWRVEYTRAPAYTCKAK